MFWTKVSSKCVSSCSASVYTDWLSRGVGPALCARDEATAGFIHQGIVHSRMHSNSHGNSRVAQPPKANSSSPSIRVQSFRDLYICCHLSFKTKTCTMKYFLNIFATQTCIADCALCHSTMWQMHFNFLK